MRVAYSIILYYNRALKCRSFYQRYSGVKRFSRTAHNAFVHVVGAVFSPRARRADQGLRNH